MNLNEKTDSPDFLAKLSKKVLRDVPGAEIISDEAAVQKDQEKHGQDLDEKGSVFPSLPIEQIIRRTKQEKDRIELKKDLKKIDKQNKKTFGKISKTSLSYGNPTKTTDGSKKHARNSQMDIDSKSRKKSPAISDAFKTNPKTRDNSFERLPTYSKNRKEKNSFDKSTLDNTKQNLISNTKKLRKSQYSKKIFDVSAGFNSSKKRNQKIQTKHALINNDSLFGMNIDSFGISGSSSAETIEGRDDFKLDSMDSPKKKYNKTPKLQAFQNSKGNNRGKHYYQNKNLTSRESFSENKKLNATIKHGDYFQINNKLDFE